MIVKILEKKLKKTFRRKQLKLKLETWPQTSMECTWLRSNVVTVLFRGVPTFVLFHI